MTITEPNILLWAREDYDHAVAAGVFDGKHVELIDGEIFAMSPMGAQHAIAIAMITRVAMRLFADYHIRIQMPLSLSDSSEPEPDVAIIQGQDADYCDAHPSAALLVIEVSDTTLAFDRSVKASLYASAGIPEYWIVNLGAGRLEVLRQPAADAGQRFGFGYAERFSVQPGAQLAPLFSPATLLEVAALLPV